MVPLPSGGDDYRSGMSAGSESIARQYTALLLSALILATGCSQRADGLELMYYRASDNSPAALLTGTPTRVGDCVRLITPEEPDGWALVFARDRGVSASGSELLVNDQVIASLAQGSSTQGSSIQGSSTQRPTEVKLGGGEMTDAQVQAEASGPKDRACNGGPIWRVSEVVG